ncbi:prolipoprotein diacylglyceryl transferase [Candidatus Gracilibacteria bacterium CG17_big_fil_post_rev_8_21_14_2_50_48_13]|nr:MAG: prolipoprotein diacylglyceryl transferase [Candidatus Gracilibacteria bacterium CG17_big_fil_post_rev_8_21_14_2_50_48_13]
MWTYSYNLDPVLFAAGPFTLRWYGLAYLFGFLFSWWFYTQVLTKKQLLGFDAKHIADILFYALIGLLIGARSVYMLVYNLPVFLEKPLSFFFIWEGGLSFHGALIGIILALTLFFRAKKIAILPAADRLILPIPLALFFGRLANFINGELIGRTFEPGTFPVCILYPPESLCRYPSQILQGLTEGLLLFVILQILFWRTSLRNIPGVIFGIFLSLYGLFRLGIEHFRAPDPQLGFLAGGLTMGQILSLLMIIVGAVFVMFAYRNRSKHV